MFYCDKKALHSLWNNSICVNTDDGIRMLGNMEDLCKENLVYIENIDKGCNAIIERDTMVRYMPVAVIAR